MDDLYNGNNLEKNKNKINKTISSDSLENFASTQKRQASSRQTSFEEEKFELNFNTPKREQMNPNKTSFSSNDLFSNDTNNNFAPTNQNSSFGAPNFNQGTVNQQSYSQPPKQQDFNKQMQEQIARNLANPNQPPVQNQQRMPTGNQRVPMGNQVLPNGGQRVPMGNQVVSNGGQRVPMGNQVLPKGGQRVQSQYNINGQAGGSNQQLPPNAANNNSDNNKPKKKKGSAKKVFGVFFLLILILILSAGAYGYSILGNLTYDATFIDENQYIDSSELFSSDSLINILFLGSDERADDSVSGSRSDTMMLCTIDTENKEIKLTSFLRDSYVYIPSKGYSTKLNAAFAYGGAQLVIDTLEYNFKVDIDQYVMVDFETFELLIDLLDGITVDDVTQKEATYMNDVVKISDPLEVGTNIMDGNTALWYCRIRYLDSDFYRTERQRKVIESIIDKVTETNIFDLIEIVEEVLPNISTNITQNELVTLAMSALIYMNYDVSQMQIPADGTWYNSTISSQAVLVMDIEENARLLEEFLTSDTVIRETEETDDD